MEYSLDFHKEHSASVENGERKPQNTALAEKQETCFLDGEQLCVSIKTKCGSSDASDCYCTKSLINLIILDALS